jgi:micrococcal nuclease
VGKLVFCVTAALLLVIGACQQRGEAAPPGRATVIRVVDGDTAHVELVGKDETVRFIGIDTPETHGRGGLRECFGKEATTRLETLLPEGTAVTVVRDVEARDRYGRLLAYIYRASDGLFVNLAMARDGYAVALTIPPNVAHTGEFVAAAGDARRADRGLWAACGGADTPIP